MSSLVLPTLLTNNPHADVDADLRQWISDLPSIVPAVAERWSLRLGEPYQPGGMCSWVAPATDPAGRDLVLKVGWWHYEADHEPDSLKLWNGDGAVLLYDQYRDGQTVAMLLERCVPGTQLSRALPGPEQDVVVAELLHRLWIEPADGQPFRPLKQMCDQWAIEFEQKLAKAPGHIDPGLARAGMELFRTLPATADRHVLLCTDLHAENILAAEREPWLVIDPKPYVGDPAYDPLQHMLHHQSLAEDPFEFAKRMAELLDLDSERLTLWLFARCVQESFDTPGARDAAIRLAPR